MHLSLLVTAILHIVSGSFANSLNDSQKVPVDVDTIHQFGTNVSLLSLAVRHTGDVLVTLENYPLLYLIEPEINGTATLVHTFEGCDVMHGIIEVGHDQFYVTCGNVTTTHADVPGSILLSHVNMTGFPEHVEVHEVAPFPDVRVLNGMGMFSKERGLVYATDSRVGNINILNVYTGELYVAVNNSLTNLPPGVSQNTASVHSVAVVDIDELKYLYFSNHAQGIIGRVPINPETGCAAGEPEIVKSNLTLVLDFVLDKDLNIFTVLNQADQFVRVDGKTGEALVLAEGIQYYGPTSVAFGRLRADKGDIYATTNGGSSQPNAVGGALFRLDCGDLAVL